MIFEHIREVFVAQHRVDFRMGVFGLRAEMNKMKLDPYKGDCCVFIHSNRRQIRAIGATPSGCFMVIKFFEGGALKQKLKFLTDPSCKEISKMELALMLEGATFTNIDKVANWGHSTVGKVTVEKNESGNIQGDVVGAGHTFQRNIAAGQAMA